jgi:hypothetical protein
MAAPGLQSDQSSNNFNILYTVATFFPVFIMAGHLHVDPT